MNKKVVPNPDQKGWEADGTTPDGTPVYKWESSGGSSGLWEQNGDDIYYNDGAVGIGTDTPKGGSSKLTLLQQGSGAGCNINFVNDHNSGFNAGISGDTKGDVVFWNESATDIKFATSNIERMRIDASGNTTFTGAVTSQGDSSILSSANNTAVNLNIRTNLSYNDSSQASITLGPAVGPVANGRTFRWRIASGGNEFGHDLKFYKTEAPSNNESVGMHLTGSSNLTVNGNIYKNGGTPVASTVDLITALTTLRNATKDETTLEGMRDALADAIGGLIENLEHEIATMPAEDSE